MLSIAFACPNAECGEAVEGALGPTTTALRCAHCGRETALPEAGAIAASGVVSACAVCGCADVYAQRDFNRRLGLGLVALGLVSGPFFHWISTVVFVGLDAGLYLLVPSVAICYACEAQVRGFDATKPPPPFDIAIHDLYRFGKRFPPRRELAIAGPRSRILLRDAARAAR